MTKKELQNLILTDKDAQASLLNDPEAFFVSKGIKLTEEGKKLNEKIFSDEFAQNPVAVFQEAGMELNEEQLEMLNGGSRAKAAWVLTGVSLAIQWGQYCM